MEDAWTLTAHDNEIVLPFFTWTSWDPIIFARAAEKLSEKETKYKIREEEVQKKTVISYLILAFNSNQSNLTARANTPKTINFFIILSIHP